jgi:hypothetical protein
LRGARPSAYTPARPQQAGALRDPTGLHFHSSKTAFDQGDASMPLPPPLTDEQRKQALEKAAIARRKRAELKEQLKSGRTTLRELLERTGDEIVGKMKVSTVLESLPGVGRVRARKIMEKLDISESRRMRGLGAKQKENLLSEFARR